MLHVEFNKEAFDNLGQFVSTATKKGLVRQGIVHCVYHNGDFLLVCESGARHMCMGRPTRVPYKNLFGKTKDWFDEWHEQHRKTHG